MNNLLKWSTLIRVSFIFLCSNEPLYAETVPDSDSVSLKCNNTEGCSIEPVLCNKVCGCDRIYKFDESTRECVIDYEYLKERTRSNNLMQSENDNIEEDGLTKNIRESTERVFKGIIYCAIFFVVCASICVIISVCVFCCHIHYSDQKLRNEVKALASRLNVDCTKKESIRKKPRDQKEESCNVIVEDANVLCV